MTSFVYETRINLRRLSHAQTFFFELRFVIFIFALALLDENFPKISQAELLNLLCF